MSLRWPSLPQLQPELLPGVGQPKAQGIVQLADTQLDQLLQSTGIGDIPSQMALHPIVMNPGLKM